MQELKKISDFSTAFCLQFKALLIPRAILWAFVALVIAVMPASATPSAFAIPEIKVVPDGDSLGISGRVIGLGTGSVLATLRIIKSDGSGRVDTSQSRQIEVMQGSSDIVATTKLSKQDNLSITVTLTLSVGEVSIASSTITIGATAD